MYKSPIEIVQENHLKDLIEKVDGYIIQEVVRIGVSVDKEELIRALKYDRDQYNAGYDDGRRDAVIHGQWVNNKNDYPECDKCGYMPQYDPMIDDIYYSPYCPRCGAKMNIGRDE